MKLRFHPEARSELREARSFYRSRSPIAALAFAHQVDTALSDIAEAPLRHPESEYGIREFVLPGRFPYTVVYRIVGSAIVIVAIAHQSREPRYWLNRS